MTHVYVVIMQSESGDHYPPTVFTKRPTAKQQKELIEKTGKKLNIGGPGAFGSYMHVDIYRCKVVPHEEIVEDIRYNPPGKKVFKRNGRVIALEG